ncbi:hypothetical protein D3C78_1568470 [compost metagenome]
MHGFLCKPQRQGHLALLGELDRVAEEILNYLPNARRVPVVMPLDLWLNGKIEYKPFFSRQRGEH